MKRRDLFKMLATLAAVPFVAPLVAMCKPKNEGFTEVQRVTGMRVINTGNDDLFGYPGQFQVCHEEAVNKGRRDYVSGARGEMSTLTSERGVPAGLTVEDMKSWTLGYRRTAGGELRYREKQS